MHDVLRTRLIRKLETLPDERLYQVLDYIEFLESKYATAQAPPPSGLQAAAERFEDRLRARALAPQAIGGTMRVIGAAGRVLDTLGDIGRGIVEPFTKPAPTRPIEPGVAQVAESDAKVPVAAGSHPATLVDEEGA